MNEEPKRFSWLVCGGFCLLAAVLRIGGLGDEALFFDEYLTSLHCAQNNFLDFLRQAVHFESISPLGFVPIWLFVRLWGDTPFVLRLPSALFGIAMVWAMMRLLFETRQADVKAMAVMGLLVALNPYHIYYSQEARPYALLVLLIACHLIFALRVRFATGAAPRVPDLVGFLGTAALMVATHYFATILLAFSFLVLAGRWLWPVESGPDTGRWRRLVPVLAPMAFLALLAGGVELVILFSKAGEKTEWLPKWGFDFPYHQWRAMVEGPFMIRVPEWLILAALGAWLVMLALAARDGRDPKKRPTLLFAVLAFVCAGILPHAVDNIRPVLFYGQRYMIVCLPAFWLLTALAYSNPALRRGWRLGLLAILLAPGLLWLGDYYRHPQKRVWDEVAKSCEERLSPGDEVWQIMPFGDGPLSYYLRDKPLRLIGTNNAARVPPSDSGRRWAVVSIMPPIMRMPPPPGWRRIEAHVYETYQSDNETYLLIFEKIPETPPPESGLVPKISDGLD